jgi:hypothetical protein
MKIDRVSVTYGELRSTGYPTFSARGFQGGSRTSSCKC